MANLISKLRTTLATILMQQLQDYQSIQINLHKKNKKTKRVNHKQIKFCLSKEYSGNIEAWTVNLCLINSP